MDPGSRHGGQHGILGSPMLYDRRSPTPPPGRLLRFEAEHPVLTTTASAILSGALAWLLLDWRSGLVWFGAMVLLGILSWMPGGPRRRYFDARVAAARAEVDGQPHLPPPVPLGTALAVLTAVLLFLGVGLVLLTLAIHVAFGGSLTWGRQDLSGVGLGCGLVAVALLLVAAGAMCIKRRPLGLVMTLAAAILGTVASGWGLAVGGGAGPLPAAYWWVLSAVSLGALVVHRRQARDSPTS